MGLLGDVLELLYGPDNRFSTVRANVRHWCDQNLAAQADAAEGRTVGRRKLRASESSRISQATLSIWISGPSRTRIEEQRERDGISQLSIKVVDGDRWWVCDTDGHVTSGQGRHGPGLIAAERHFGPAQIREFFQALSLEALGTVLTAGRECVRLRGTLRPGASLWPHWLPTEADEYEFHADKERGALLAIISRFAGQPFEIDEVVEVKFDEVLDAAIFSYTPLAGEQVCEPVPVSEHLTLASAMQRMNFTVLVPTRLPDPERARLEVMFHPARLESPLARLYLFYRNFETPSILWLAESSAADPELEEAYEWEPVEFVGQKMRISDPGVGERIVVLERQGTHVVIWSDLDRDRLLDLAASLVPATEAPRL